MIFCTSLGQVVSHTLSVCVLLSIISTSCNISRIDKPSKHYNRASPKLCGLESLGFITNSPQINHEFLPQKYNETKSVENYVEDEECSKLVHYKELPVFAERPGTHVSRTTKPARSSLLSGEFFTSRVKSLRDAVSKLSKEDLMKGATSLSFLSLYYLGKALYYNSNKKLVSYLNNRVALWVLNMLSAVPFFALKWVLGLQSPPVFYPLQYTPEKINFKVDGVLGSVKKTLKNGVNRVKSYVMAYKTVMLQTTFLLAPKILTDSTSLLTFRNTFFFNFLQTMDPALTSLIYYFFDDLKLDTKTYLSLLPLVTGAAYATYPGFGSSLGVLAYFVLTNLAGYFTNDEMKEFLSQNMDKVGKNLTKSNLNSTVTISLYLLLSFVLVSEGCGFSYACDNLLKRIKGGDYGILKYIFLSGLSNYMMSTARFGLFSELSPITKSVATTMLNLFTSLVSSVLSEGKLSKNELYGTALAIAGTFLYLLTK